MRRFLPPGGASGMLDGDLHRDDAVSFGPRCVVSGALLPYAGRVALRSPDGPPAGALDAKSDGWAAPSVPVLVRAAARIVPLAWWGDPGAVPRGIRRDEFGAFAAQLQAAGEQWAGMWRVLDLTEARTDSVGSYAAALCASGATRADVWTLSEERGLALVWAGAAEEGTLSLALHIVPSSWVSESRAAKAVRGLDLAWSWTEVVALNPPHSSRASGEQG